jgi:RND family efflux transporter MFP subunit
MKEEPNLLKPQKKERKWLKRIWGILPTLFFISILIVIIMLFSRISSESKLLEEAKKSQLRQKQPDVNVVTLELIPSVIRDRISLPGTVAPWVKLDVLTEVGGKVLKKEVEEGNTVKKGDILAVLDSRDYQNAFNSAKASYETAVSSLNRFQKLHSEQLAPRSQLDEAVAQSENHKAAKDTAALNLERCTIRAPISGVINHLYIDNGQYLSASDKVAEILQMEQVKVKVGIPESDVDAVRHIEDFNVTIDALNGKVFPAKKHFISRTADAAARLYGLDLALDNSSGEILPDMFARIEIIKKEEPASLCVPLYAVISKDNENIVYVVKEGKSYLKAVKLGLKEEWRVQVTEGLEAGEHVIVVGHRSVNNDQTVKVVRSVRDPKEIIR